MSPPPPIFSFPFSLCFLPLSQSLPQTEMHTDFSTRRFRVTCPLYPLRIKFSPFSQRRKEVGEKPLLSFPSPDCFLKTRMHFILSLVLGTFILTQ